MHSAVEPGSRLATRYRLLGPVTTGSAAVRFGSRPSTALAASVPHWLARDEMLNRPVTVRVLDADVPYAPVVLAAARRAATVDDPRFLSILDADRADGLAYVVTEWVDGVDLVELLAGGPLPAGEARWLATEVARALAAAHAAGLGHGCLVPEAVLLTENGRVKVSGLAVRAALAGQGYVLDDRLAALDLRSAGAVLFAALTGRWPLAGGQDPSDDGTGRIPPETRLASAPLVDGLPCAPRQVRAAVPADLDEIARLALGAPLRRGDVPLASVAELATALGGPEGLGADSGTGPVPVVAADVDEMSLLATPGERGRFARALGSLVAVLLAAGLALLGWQVGAARPDPPPDPPTTGGTPSAATGTTPAVPPGTLLPVVTAYDFDPEGNDQEENGNRVDRAIDDDPSTLWTTEEYYNSPLGGLKSGVGLVLDLGAQRDVATVTLQLLGLGSTVELRVAGGVARPGAAADYRVVAAEEGVGSLVTLRPEEPVRARYLLIWFTSPPTSGEDRYRAGVADVQVRS